MERWFRFFCFAFVVYAVIHGQSLRKSAINQAASSSKTIQNNTSQGTSFKPAMVEASEDSGVVGKMVAAGLNKVVTGLTMDPEAEAKLRSLLRETTENMAVSPYKIISEQKGTGEMAYCGARVTLLYSLRTSVGAKETILETKEEPITIEIGEHHMIPAMENAIIGMRAGGKRSVRIPVQYVQHHIQLQPYFKDHKGLNQPVTASLQLQKVYNPNSEAAAQPLLQHFIITKGRGAPAICGDKVTIIYQLKKTNVMLLKAKKKPASMQLVLRFEQLPIAFERSLMGMQAGEKRMVLVPGLLLKTPKNPLSLEQEYDLNDAEIYQLEIQLIHIQ